MAPVHQAHNIIIGYTDNFKRKIGEGGFGKVYSGKMQAKGGKTLLSKCPK